MYSQSDEESYVLELGDNGRYLEIGSYDGKTFSNTRALAEKGWEGVCVEPAPHAFDAMCSDPPPHAILVNALVGKHTGLVRFHYSKDAVSTTERKHARKWASLVAFTPIHVMAISVSHLLTEFPGPFDLISVDTEGTTVQIVEDLIPHLDTLETRCLIYEHDEVFLKVPGFDEVHRTPENAILVRS